MARAAAQHGQGVRRIRLEDQAVSCRMLVNEPAYDLRSQVRGKAVLDIGCGFGWNRMLVEEEGGSWVGIEPFEGGAHTLAGDAEALPFSDASFDVVIVDAVLEHIPLVERAFAEIARVLRPDGVMLGYSAFMECFHEISYSHLSYKALERYARSAGMNLEVVSGGSAFGIDYHFAVLMHPLPVKWMRPFIAKAIRAFVRSKASVAGALVGIRRGLPAGERAQLTSLYYTVECLRQSNGFTFVIRRV